MDVDFETRAGTMARTLLFLDGIPPNAVVSERFYYYYSKNEQRNVT